MEGDLPFQIKRTRLTDEVLAREPAKLERRYKMTSADFLPRFNSGELGDDLEFIRWAGLLSIAAKTGLRTCISSKLVTPQLPSATIRPLES